jgi:hypothetical protein
MTDPSLRTPNAVRSAGAIVAAQGIAGLLAAVVYVVSGIRGGEEPGLSMFGTAAWFAIFGGAVVAAGRALWTGRRWGRGVAVFAQLLLLPVAWYLAVGSQQWIYGIGVGIVALITLVLLFSPSAVQWLGSADDH